jgi:hypothetical protein
MTPEQKLAGLLWYVNHGWPVFPCGPDKKPLTKNGFKDATLNAATVKSWHEKMPGALWGMATGPTKENAAGLVVIDIDTHDENKNGYSTWEQLREEYSEPIETVTAKTGGGGQHLYFQYPAGHIVKSGQDVLGPGIDVRARGGYVIVPPSEKYMYEFSPRDTAVMELPAWILSRVNGTLESTEQATEIKPASDDLGKALNALNALKPERAENYDSWLHVGMALYELGDDGLIAWDTWSKQSSKYAPGACAKKWATFNKDLTQANKINLNSLIYWAREDGNNPTLQAAPKLATPVDYKLMLETCGYKFSMNDMNDMIYINGLRFTDILEKTVKYKLRTFGYRNDTDTTVSIAQSAYENIFHPIKDYLNGLIAEGHYDGARIVPVDHIKRLASFFEDKDGTFEILLRKWLVGAVGRILGEHPGQQHPMLVLDGPQGIGKSRFAWWLGSPLPAFYLQNSINTQDKDFLIMLCSKWIWEVEELGATIRRSDIESLKAFLSKEIVTVRKAYGREDIVKPATASFIGTINNSGGFLADPTGSRRFRVCTLSKIDWAYESAIDVNQVWAQAVALYQEGERWQLDAETNKKMMEINSRYDVDDPLQWDLFETFNITPGDPEKFTASAQIIKRLRDDGKIVGGSDQQIAKRLADIFVKLGCERALVRVNGQPTRVWRGVWAR